jgi:hypothetical protein
VEAAVTALRMLADGTRLRFNSCGVGSPTLAAKRIAASPQGNNHGIRLRRDP